MFKKLILHMVLLQELCHGNAKCIRVQRSKKVYFRDMFIQIGI